jgi:hypothetical protein
MGSGSCPPLVRGQPFSHLMVKSVFINDAHQSERTEVQDPCAWRSRVPEDEARPRPTPCLRGRALIRSMAMARGPAHNRGRWRG